MLGYLNAQSPFDEEGWYQTNDLVKVEVEYIKVVGRNNDIVNVGGLKFLLSEVELIAYANKDIELAAVKSAANPITGQHVEITVQIRQNSGLTLENLREYFASNLPSHMRPRRIFLDNVSVGHRHKKL